MMKNCKVVKEKIQNYFDDGTPVSEDARNHITACPDCQTFQIHIGKFRSNLRDILDREVTSKNEPDFSKLSVPPKRSYHKALSWVAAVLVVITSTGIGVSIYDRIRTDSFIKEENRYFLQELMNRGLFDVGSTVVAMDSSNWFSADASILPSIEPESVEE